jgi:hypothetical protein
MHRMETEKAMYSEAIKNLWALRKLNKSLLEGLKLAIFVLKNQDDLSGRRGMPWLQP